MTEKQALGTRNSLSIALNLVGFERLEKATGLSHQNFYRWRKDDRMPHTEYSGSTSYSLAIQKETNNEITVFDLLGFVPPHMVDEVIKLEAESE